MGTVMALHRRNIGSFLCYHVVHLNMIRSGGELVQYGFKPRAPDVPPVAMSTSRESIDYNRPPNPASHSTIPRVVVSFTIVKLYVMKYSLHPGSVLLPPVSAWNLQSYPYCGEVRTAFQITTM